MRNAPSAIRACALAATLAASSRAAADDACISPKVDESLSSCGGVTISAPAEKRAARLPAPPPPPKAKGPAAPHNDDATQNAVNVRRAAASPRATELLITEIQGVESLIGSAPKGSPDLPKLVRRVADDYLELEGAAVRANNAKLEKSSRQAAIKNLRRLAADFPQWCRVSQPSPSGCADDALYDLAYELELDKQPDKARPVYLDLIQKYPTSKHVPQAYLAFGELYFQEAQGDPTKWQLAEQAYKEVLKFPAAQNPASGYAQYKLGYVYWNKGDYAQALTAMKRTIEVAATSQAPGSSGLAANARRDLVPIYAVSGDAKRAATFFQPLAGGDDKLVGMLASLGQAYADTGHYDDSIEVFRDLQKRDPSHACGYEARIAEAVLASRSGDKKAIVLELGALADMEAKTQKGTAANDVKQACANDMAEILSETAMAWHVEALGSGGVRGTNDPKTFDAAAALYERVVTRFSASELASFTFSKIVKEDWPTKQKLDYLRADLLYARKDWAKCGPAFDAVVAEDPKGSDAGEAAYTSALCYENAFHAARAGGKERARLGDAAARASAEARELGADEKAMIGSFERFLCVAKGAKKDDKETAERVVDVEFARARILFEARRWEEAAAAFRRVALGHPASDAASAAGDLELEALNVLLQSGRSSCLATIKQDDAKLQDALCKTDKRKDDEEACGRFERVGRDVERATIDELVKRGDKTGDAKLLEQAGDRYLAIWNATGAAACEAKKPECAGMDAVLSNAARAYQAAHLLAKAISVRKVLVDPKYHLEQTDPARKAVREIGANYQAIAVYDEAAHWLERFGRENPTKERAPESLEDAVVLSLGLGDEEKAFAAATAFERTYGSRKPALSAQIAYALGEHLALKGAWGDARRRLVGAMPLVDRSASIDVQVAAHALLGRALGALGKDGSSELAKVRAIFRDPAAVAKKIEAQAGDDKDEAQRRLRRALNAWGQAIYAAGEEKRRAVDAIKLPEYKGAGGRDDVERFVKTELLKWMQKKQPAIEAAEKEYGAILDVQPSPPPEWVVASGARVGQLWSRFVGEFRAAPIPAEWKQNGMSPAGIPWETIRLEYYAAIDKASEPFKLRAKAAMQKCLKYAVTFQHFGDDARTCERWLAKWYPSEFHAIDELRGEPSRAGGTVTLAPAPLPSRTQAGAFL